MSVWHELISKGKAPTDGELGPHHEQVSAALAGNVYSFGVLLLEIISGKLPDPAHDRSLVSLVMISTMEHHLTEKKNILKKKSNDVVFLLPRLWSALTTVTGV